MNTPTKEHINFGPVKHVTSYSWNFFQRSSWHQKFLTVESEVFFFSSEVLHWEVLPLFPSVDTMTWVSYIVRPFHCGTKPGHFETLLSHEQGSERSERASDCSGGHERSEQSEASEWVSGARERANGRASGPVLTSVFLVDRDLSAVGALSPGDL